MIKKILEFLAEKNRWAILLVIILFLIGSSWIRIQHNKINNLNDKYKTEVNLKKALLDTITTYQNKQGEWVSEKLTIQASLNELKNMNNQLTADQKKLINKINEVNKNNSVITAALIKANFIIDSLKHSGIVNIDTANKQIEFLEEKNPYIRYDLTVNGVLPYSKNTKPSLLINNLTLPNEQFIEFHWTDNKKQGYPISFSVTNTNKYMKVYDVNSYAIPEIKKDVVNPTGWQKFGIWFKKNSNTFAHIAEGIIIGGTGTYILLK